MLIIRTDDQADALEILKLIIETADFYRAMGELLTEENVNHPLFDIAKQRESYIESFRKVVKQLHELPATPDSDKEWVDELGGRMTNLFSADSTQAILDKCLKKDEVLAELINNTALAEQSTEFKKLLDSLYKHLAETKQLILNN
ncbi:MULTISPECIES: hypothetical protein [unclassified Methylophaga]|jgi:hypothetical protein|uniref:hypothetical protein n=1 Tax=unclassified Methylophaga TaxID=2629249 RepID=UPI000C917E3E|nr:MULTISPECIES: hypothetical protein [unclassified Methylophaga]MAK66349.1 hypothetical protein [Methylophaga sp.]MAY17043.1 hypothetical protein [Methylophaga sp.]HAO24372.1 hypothetical protein [Methylophaga sp.]|tara:strand:- start:33149 stop:33583 length:435 start_codon:yes stop_codon:yes gene_type:complete